MEAAPEIAPEAAGAEAALSPFEERLRQRDAIYNPLFPNSILTIEEIRAIVNLKGELVDRMSVFDADPFFMENKELIIREGTIHRNGGELSLRSLGKKLQELNEAGFFSLHSAS
jgi:hypothetical protein